MRASSARGITRNGINGDISSVRHKDLDPVSRRLYDPDIAPGITSCFIHHVPKATGIHAFQVDAPEDLLTLNGVSELTVNDWAFFRFILDAIGIRNRAAVMKEVVKGHARNRLNLQEPTVSWLSVACGTTRPTMQGASEIAAELNINPSVFSVTAVDYDKNALSYVQDLADKYGVTLNSIKTHDILKGTMSDALGGEKYDLVEALGFFEYLGHKESDGKGALNDHAVTALSDRYRQLAEGGMLIFGNMSDEHHQLKFATDVGR